MSKRDELVKELIDLPVLGKTAKGGKALGWYLKAEDILTIIDWNLADRRRVLERVRERIKQVNPKWNGLVLIQDDYYTPPKNLTVIRLGDILSEEESNV